MNFSLKFWNTFGIHQYANNIICVESVEKLISVWKKATEKERFAIILGEGSNVLFLEDFNGTVIINKIMGIRVTESNYSWRLHVGAGENWHKLVQFTMINSIPGLENLALIPGSAGSSPIQNIGAYGAELKNFFQYSDCVELNTGKFQRLESKFCRLRYRDSIFKHEYKNTYAVTAIGIQLSKNWKPILTYGDLKNFNPKTVTPEEIFNFVCQVRIKKLPDPKVNGNAGSFFKNPVVSYEIAKDFLSHWPNSPHYLQHNGFVKLSAGWLIDQCNLKGITYGGASVYRHQALVLINEKNATSKDVIRLAKLVRKRVGEKFNVWLEPEVRFIGSIGEVNAVEIIS